MKFFTRKKKRIYLDYAAATPVRSRVQEVMKPYLSEHFANASAIHREGVLARQAIEDARERIARLLKARPEHVYFTGSGTESNNLAILGTLEARRAAGVAYEDMEIISTRLEHPSVAQALKHAVSLGVRVHYAEVDETGLIDQVSFSSLLSEKTVLCTFAYINSEIGVIQEVGKLVRTVRAFEKKTAARIYVHIDGAQAPLWANCEIDRLMVDMISLDAGKCYGPKGMGLLVLRHGTELSAITHGGPQEGGLRPATENVPGIVGTAEALTLAQEQYEDRVARVQRVRDTFIAELLKINGVVLNGHQEKRVANNVNISIPGIDSEFAVVVLDEAGVACATKSACSGTDGAASSVVMAISNDTVRAQSTLRFTLGEDTTTTEVTKTAKLLRAQVQKTRATIDTLTQ